MILKIFSPLLLFHRLLSNNINSKGSEWSFYTHPKKKKKTHGGEHRLFQGFYRGKKITVLWLKCDLRTLGSKVPSCIDN